MPPTCEWGWELRRRMRILSNFQTKWGLSQRHHWKWVGGIAPNVGFMRMVGGGWAIQSPYNYNYYCVCVCEEERVGAELFGVWVWGSDVKESKNPLSPPPPMAKSNVKIFNIMLAVSFSKQRSALALSPSCGAWNMIWYLVTLYIFLQFNHLKSLESFSHFGDLIWHWHWHWHVLFHL